MKSYFAQEPKSVVGCQASVLFKQSLSFDLQLLSFMVILTIVHSCKYILYMSNTLPWLHAKKLSIAHLVINHITGKIDQVKFIFENELPGSSINVKHS